MGLWYKPAITHRPKATRIEELNAAISQLWQDQATHDKASFKQQIVPIYTTLLEQLKQHQITEAAEQQLLSLLDNTAKACRYRWTLRLPLKRPGSDYRKYEIIYTDALVTAMAVGSLQPHHPHQSPEQLATRILSKEAIARLKADPIVWEDWLGYFQQADPGGLYAVSICTTPTPPPRKATATKQSTAPLRQNAFQPQKPPPAGSGRAMLAAIRQALADGSLSFNRPGDAVQVDGQGRTFLEHPKILTVCRQQLALDDDVKRLKSRFSRLKVLKRSEQGHQLYYGRLGKHDRRRVGYVLENPTVLWQESPPAGSFIIEQVTGPAVEA